MHLESLGQVKGDVAAQSKEDNVTKTDIAGVAHNDIHTRGEGHQHQHQKNVFAQGRIVGDNRNEGNSPDHDQDEPEEGAG
jgi:hypothetical protein